MAVCYCGEDRATCQTCGKGFSQERAAGRTPKFLTEAEFKAKAVPKSAGPLTKLLAFFVSSYTKSINEVNHPGFQRNSRGVFSSQIPMR